jgi:hypothetical protein
MWGPTFPELVEALPGIEIIDRSSVNAFDDARVARSIEGTGRKKLIFAVSRSKSAPLFRLSQPSGKDWTLTSRSMLRERSVRRNVRPGSFACCRQV